MKADNISIHIFCIRTTLQRHKIKTGMRADNSTLREQTARVWERTVHTKRIPNSTANNARKRE